MVLSGSISKLLEQCYALIPKVWMTVLAALVVVALALSGWLWRSGTQDTDDAFASGRRLLITLEDGTIAGNVITTEIAPLPETTAEAVADGQTPAASPEATTPETTEEAIALPEEAPEDSVPPPTEHANVMEDWSSKELKPVPAARMMAERSNRLIEKSEIGMLPVIGSDGAKPWSYYAKPFTRSGNKPMIAIIVTNVGHHKTLTENTLRLPENITLSFSPYARELDRWAKSARATGHEILMDLPMEPSNYPATDPGPHGMILARGASANNEQLEWVMSRLPVYVGLMTPQDERFSADNEALRLLLQSLNNRGLMIVIGREPAKNETKEIIDSTNIANVVVDMVIDEDLTAAIIQAHLEQLEQLAKVRGYAVGVAGPYPITVQQLRLWSATLEKKGILLVPVTAIAKLRFS